VHDLVVQHGAWRVAVLASNDPVRVFEGPYAAAAAMPNFAKTVLVLVVRWCHSSCCQCVIDMKYMSRFYVVLTRLLRSMGEIVGTAAA
jgi:hypothetical protein